MNDTDYAGPLLQTVQLVKRYDDGEVLAVDHVNLSVERQEFVAIMGPSGCGKSTLLNLLGALDRPTSGEVVYHGVPLSSYHSLDSFRARQIGFVFQAFYLLPTLTAEENVQVPMLEVVRNARARRERAMELLNLVGLGHRRRQLSTRLSVGERQRVAIARALANQPRVLLADEPTGNLDSANAARVIDLFQELHRTQRLTLILVTHGQEVARRAQRVIHMVDGRIVEHLSSNAPNQDAANHHGESSI